MAIPSFTFPSISLVAHKKAILWLLAASCLAAFFILLSAPAEPYRGLESFDRADSLIFEELALFNVPEEQIRTFRYPVTDNFIRKRYVVDLPSQISKTHLHAELNKQLKKWQVGTIGYVDIPSREMTLHLHYRDKIIRTIDLRTDSELVRIPHPASLMVYFDQRPSASQLERLRDIGAPVGVVLRSASRRSLIRWAESLPDDITPIWVWHDDSQTTYQKTRLDDPDLMQALEAVSRARQTPRLLAFDIPEHNPSEELKEMGITITDGSGMRIISSNNRFEFDQQMLTYSRLARQAGTPKVLIRATDNTLDWLEEWIPRIQRGGVVFVLS